MLEEFPEGGHHAVLFSNIEHHDRSGRHALLSIRAVHPLGEALLVQDLLRADCGGDVGRAFGHDNTRDLIIRGPQELIFDELFNVVSCTCCPLLSSREGFHIVRGRPRLIARLRIHVQAQFQQRALSMSIAALRT